MTANDFKEFKNINYFQYFENIFNENILVGCIYKPLDASYEGNSQINNVFEKVADRKKAESFLDI